MSSTTLNTGVQIPQNVEPIVCSKCGWVNTIEAKPFSRRSKKDKHMWLEEEVFLSLKTKCIPYHSFNNGISMLMYELDKYRTMNSKDRIRNTIQVRSLDDEITNSRI
jgi:hypothetical protein